MQVTDTALQFGVLTTSRIQAFLSHCQLVGQRLAASRTGIATASGLTCFSSDQFQAITRLCSRRRSARCGAASGIQLTRSDSTAFTPGGILLGNLSDRLGIAAAANLLFVRQAKYLTALHTVDIAADEGIRIQILNGQHDLIDRATTDALGDFPERIVGSGSVFVTGNGARRRGRCGRTRGRSGCCSARRRSGSKRRRRTRCRRGDRQLRRSGYGSLRRVKRRIEQQGVFTQQAPVRPEHFNQEVEVRLTHALARGDADNALAVGLQYRGELEVGQKVLTVDASFDELLRGREAGNHLIGSKIAYLQQFDFRYQRLIQRRLQGNFTKSQRMRHTGRQRGSGCDCQHQFANPNHSVIPCFIFFSACEWVLRIAACLRSTSGSPFSNQLSQYCQARKILQNSR